MIFTTDDVCPSNLKYFSYWERVRQKYPNMKLIAFTIANYNLVENVSVSTEFKEWFEKNKDWVEVAVHGYDHMYKPEAERDDPEFENCIMKALSILKPFLPEKYGYRSPGFQWSVRTEPLMKKYGFSWIAYDDSIKYFDGRPPIVGGIINTHCCDKWDNPITQVWNKI